MSPTMPTVCISAITLCYVRHHNVYTIVQGLWPKILISLTQVPQSYYAPAPSGKVLGNNILCMDLARSPISSYLFSCILVSTQRFSSRPKKPQTRSKRHLNCPAFAASQRKSYGVTASRAVDLSHHVVTVAQLHCLPRCSSPSRRLLR